MSDGRGYSLAVSCMALSRTVPVTLYPRAEDGFGNDHFVLEVGDAGVDAVSDISPGSDARVCGRRCVDTQSDPRRCGACGTQNATARRESDLCRPMCTIGCRNSDGDVANEREQSLAELTRCGSDSATTVARCGSCGAARGSVGVVAGSRRRESSVCQFQCIARTHRDCDRDAQRGCEIAIRDAGRHGR